MTETATPRRPTDEERQQYVQAWEVFITTEQGAELRQLFDVRSDDRLRTFFCEQYVASCLLEDLTRALGAPKDFCEDLCFKFGRMTAMNPDIWKCFDKAHAYAIDAMASITKRKEWAEVPVPQDVPEPTRLFTDWFKWARNSVGAEGVYPQAFMHMDAEGKTTMEALALNSDLVFEHLIKRFAESQPTESIIGIDLAAVPGQGTEFTDFLAVIWYINGQFYTGVVNYQRSTAAAEGQEPIFRPVDWNNNYWNHSLREYPIPQLVVKPG